MSEHFSDMYIVIETTSEDNQFVYYMDKKELTQWLGMKDEDSLYIIEDLDPAGIDMDDFLVDDMTSAIMIIKGGIVISPTITKSVKYNVD